MKYFRILILLIVAGISFLSIASFGRDDTGLYDQSLDNYRMFGPGVVFSLYIIIQDWGNRKWIKSILYFFILFAAYAAAFITGITSWGMAVPFAGGIGALLVKLLFVDVLFEEYIRLYFISGFAAALAGLILYFAFKDNINPEGIRFGIIILFWQITVGFLLLNQKQNENR